MKPRLLVFALAALTLVFAAGCQSIEDRIKQKPDVFAKLDKLTQEKIKQGIIDLGYSFDMVYLALGEPNEKHETITETGKTETWVYNTYFQRYDGTAFVGYERRIYYDPTLRTYRTYFQPAYADVYRQDKEEQIRIVFKDGKVTVIEQAKK
ncbi:MAG: hypothetical protein HY302_12315 [Opitutae bacterium]|nr:hypothetical protein [Opitutae bacterium]